MLNISKGNMYPFVTHTWNAIKGKCPHDCVYCYMKIFPQKELRLDEKEFNTNLGEGNFIFVGSSTDMWCKEVPDDWINRVLNYCKKFNNKYLFQTKNPAHFVKYEFPKDTILACTLETNRQYPFGKAPPLILRYGIMASLEHEHKMISIEPVMDFDLDVFIEWIREIKPDFVSIGADSKNHNLLEPSKEKLVQLIIELGKITKIVQKKNLARLLK